MPVSASLSVSAASSMIVVDNEVSNSPTPSLLDSPTLARVERARIRNESTSTYNSPLNHTMSSYCPVIAPSANLYNSRIGFFLQHVEWGVE
ncbi:hypothetical protein WDU94_008441 [Cyamophila willieti]